MDTNDVAVRAEKRPHAHVFLHSFLPNTWKCGLCGHTMTDESMPAAPAIPA